MLYNDENVNHDPEGHNPTTDNSKIIPKKESKWLIIFFFIITLGLFGIYYITQRNALNQLQIKVNECASSIDVQLAKRKDTLVKLLDATKSMCNYEKTLLEDVTKLRSSMVNNQSREEVDGLSNSVFSRIFAVSENYPEIKASEAFQKLMNSADYLEREIAASRRTYNSAVANFNQHLVYWPSSFIAAKHNMHSIKMFAASTSQKEDVNLSF